MIHNIEKEYRKLNEVDELHCYVLTKTTIITAFLYILSYFFKVSNSIIWILLLVSIVILVIMALKKDINYTKISNNILDNIKFSVQKKNDYRHSKFIKFLKVNNINSRDEIKILIDYFSKKVPVTLKSSTIITLVNSAVVFATFMVSFVKDNSNTLDVVKFETVIILMFLYGLFYLIIKFVIFLIIKISKEELYSDLVDDLIYIYVNFDDYFCKSNRNKILKFMKHEENYK